MKQDLAAYTSIDTTYPSFINVSCTDEGMYEVTVRGPSVVEITDGKTRIVPGGISMITMTENAMMGFLDELNDKF